MARKSFDQYCGLARALELVGERWALLVVRELLLGPKRFNELAAGLPRIPSNVLSGRLRELEEAGLVQRRLLPRPASGTVYELTEDGRALEPVVITMGMWGARFLGEPRPEEAFRAGWAVLGLRGALRPERVRDLRASYELAVDDELLNVVIDRGRVTTAEGPLADADLSIHADLATFAAVVRGELEPAEAVAGGKLRLVGEPALLDRFVAAIDFGPSGQAAPR